MSPAEINYLLGPTLTMIACGLLGAALGSYLGCAAYRIPNRLSMNRGSFCPGCGKPVPFYLNIPVFAFLVLRGKSACCKSPLSPGYLAYETGTLVLGALIGRQIGVVWMLGLAVAVIIGVWAWAQIIARQPETPTEEPIDIAT